MEQQLYETIAQGQEAKVREILRGHPTIDVNWAHNQDGFTALHQACLTGQTTLLSLLLAHPGIAVNAQTPRGTTPFSLCCAHGITLCGRLLLRDSRVTVDQADKEESPPAWHAARDGHLGILKWWIGSGREMNLGEPGNEKSDAVLAARREEKTAVVTLLEQFRENPEETRSQVRKELGIICKSTYFLQVSELPLTPLFFFPLFLSLSLQVSRWSLPPPLTPEEYQRFLDGKPVTTAGRVEPSSLGP